MNLSKISAPCASLLFVSLFMGSCVLSAADDATTIGVASATATGVATKEPQSDEIARLKAALAEQQKQLQTLQQALQSQQALLDKVIGSTTASSGLHATLGEVASAVPFVPAVAIALPAPQAVANATGNALADTSKKVDNLTKALGGFNVDTRVFGLFRFSGDMRFRFDLQDREANSVAGPVQNARERYRFRFNIDKDMFLNEQTDRPMAHVHVQLSTAPFNNAITNDTDFAGIDTKAPISIAEAYVDVLPVKGLTLRAGRTAELFADNRQYLWDDDVRFNGFHETYRFTGKKNGLFVEGRAAQYILTNPNTPIVAAGSPYLSAGYALGQRVPSAAMFDQGIVLGSSLGKKWSHNWTGNYLIVREANQIQLASTAAGYPLFTSPILGATLTGPLTQTGNATTTNGGATYYASDFRVLRGAVNLNYSGTEWMGHNFPLTLFLQGSHNTGAKTYQNGYALGAAFGQAVRLGDVQLQYQYLYKPANAFISQFTDDDVGTGTGVNIKTNQIRVNFGINRFLVWENRLYIQSEIAKSNPAINFFVPAQQGTAVLFRLHSQFLFTF